MPPTTVDAPPDSPASGGRVLIVDDDPAQLRACRRALERVGVDVEEAADGASAVTHVADGRFNVLVSDVEMPGMEGVSLLRAVRRIDLDVPIILVPGEPSVETTVLAVELGALRYLLKPYDTATLRSVVLQAVQLSRLAKLRREAVDLVGDGMNQVGDRAGLEASFERALASLWMAFQPIVSLSKGRPLAYEALLRSGEPTP